MIYAARSVTGKRAKNEDAVFIPKGGEISLVAVADGMGGHNAGNVASAIAVETLASELKKGGPGGPTALVRNAVNHANTAVFEYAKVHPECRGMGTTLVMALLFKTRFVAANVGCRGAPAAGGLYAGRGGAPPPPQSHYTSAWDTGL